MIFFADSDCDSRSVRTSTAGAVGASYGSLTPVKLRDLAGARLRVEAFDVALRRPSTSGALTNTSTKSWPASSRELRERRARVARTARSRRRTRARRASRACARRTRCGGRWCRGRRARSRGPARGRAGSRHRRELRPARRAASSRADRGRERRLAGAREAGQPDDGALRIDQSGTSWSVMREAGLGRPRRPCPSGSGSASCAIWLGDAVVDLAREALRRALDRAAGLVDGERQRDLAARARVLLQVLLVAALEAGHVRALDLREHDVGRQASSRRTSACRLTVDATGRRLLFLAGRRRSRCRRGR